MNSLFQEERIKAIPSGSYIQGVDTGVKYDVNSQIIRGTITFAKDKLKELDQSYSGYTHIFVTRMPYYLEQLKNGKQIDNNPNIIKAAAYHYNNLKALFELASTSYNGTPDLTLGTSNVNMGWAERNIDLPTTAAYDGTQFTIKCLETRSEPLRNGKEFFINGVSDALGKFTDYYGATDDYGNPLEMLMEYHTFDFMILQTDPTLRNIQDISIWRNAFFTEAPRDQLNWDLGTVETVQPSDTQFRGIYLPNGHQNKEILDVAKTYLAKRLQMYKKLTEFSAKDFGIS